jgi:hypothetical protein
MVILSLAQKAIRVIPVSKGHRDCRVFREIQEHKVFKDQLV